MGWHKECSAVHCTPRKEEQLSSMVKNEEKYKFCICLRTDFFSPVSYSLSSRFRNFGDLGVWVFFFNALFFI